MNVFFVFVFYTEIQDGGQKWRENDFWQKCQMTVYILWAKIFAEIAPSHTVSEILKIFYF